MTKPFEIGDRVRVIKRGDAYHDRCGTIRGQRFVVELTGGSGPLFYEPGDLVLESQAAAPPKIEAGKWYRTRGGQKAYIYATGRLGSCSVHGYILYRDDECEEVNEWRDDGRSNEECETHRDLVAPWVDEPKRHARWFNLQPYYGYETRDDADCADKLSDIKRNACKLIEWTEGEGLEGYRP